MKHYLGKLLFGIVAVAILRLVWSIPQVSASSSQAYNDYVFMFGQYRTFYNDFQVAINQYHQFGSLETQQDALDRAKKAIAQRDTVVRTYLLYLNEKLTENPGLTSADRQLYRSIITNVIASLDQHSTMVPSISSIQDVEASTQEFLKQYSTIQSGIRQTVVAVQLGYLNFFAQQFETAAVEGQQLINANRFNTAPAKQAALDRWLLEISNKRSLYRQKAQAIRTNAFKLTGDEMEQNQKFSIIQTDLAQSRQYLIEGLSFLSELEKALKTQ